MWRLGIGVRPPFWSAIFDRALPLDYLEVTAEHFFDAPDERFHLLRQYPVAVHSLGFSLGSREPLDDVYLRQVCRVAERVQAHYMSGHLAFTRAAGVDLGHLNPVPLNQKMFARIADKVSKIQDLSGRRFLLENITTHLALQNEIPEPVFLSELAAATGCGILLDVTNLYVNARNHGFDEVQYLTQLDTGAVCQVHLIGYGERDGQLQDDHDSAVQPSLLALLQRVLREKRDVPTVLEWDRNFPPLELLQNNLKRVRETIDGCSERTREIAGL